ncbi:hypothetical protein INT45_007549 [Circinella minor]|uniref:Uncharacterized protein n=1 Tax=Circinella minor TaxID=1195481 RepID=A0A8H7VMP3_9FUNG|nr:hypothetical protein INT45_007549 [Circinella minor]
MMNWQSYLNFNLIGFNNVSQAAIKVSSTEAQNIITGFRDRDSPLFASGIHVAWCSVSYSPCPLQKSGSPIERKSTSKVGISVMKRLCWNNTCVYDYKPDTSGPHYVFKFRVSF